MQNRLARLCVLFILILFTGIPVAQACLGVSRTITVRSFNAHMGTGPSGVIGLRPKEVVLTFDDGPIPGRTTKVLDALANECTKATFFVVGAMARAYPKLLQRIARSGHTIAHHTNAHENLTHGSLANAQQTIERGVRTVERALGPYKKASSRLFRYPYLARSAALDAIIKRRGLLPFSAGVMSQDWKPGSGAAMVDRVMSRLNRKGRGVILLHDIQTKTANALPLLLKRLKRGGYKIVHIKGSGTRSFAPAALASKSRSKPKKLTKVAALDAPSPRKRWSLFRKNPGSHVDPVTTGSVKKKTSRKTVSKVILKKKDAVSGTKTGKSSPKKRTRLSDLFKKSKEKREAEKKAKQLALAKKKATASKNTASKKPAKVKKPVTKIAKTEKKGLRNWLKRNATKTDSAEQLAEAKRKATRKRIAEDKKKKADQPKRKRLASLFKSKNKKSAKTTDKKPRAKKSTSRKAAKSNKKSAKKTKLAKAEPKGLSRWLKRNAKEQNQAEKQAAAKRKAARKRIADAKKKKAEKPKRKRLATLFKRKGKDETDKRSVKKTKKRSVKSAKKVRSKKIAKTTVGKKKKVRSKISTYFRPNRRKADETDKAYHARLRAIRLKKNRAKSRDK